MSGGRFLVSLREVTNSERIICCRSLVKADINFWKEDLGSDKPSLDFSALLALLSEHEIEIVESTLDSSSEEVSTTIAGYITKKLACVRARVCGLVCICMYTSIVDFTC